MIAYSELLKIRSPSQQFAWTDRETMLYALAIGLGRHPLDPHELQFVYERDLKVLPSFATVAAWGCNPPLAEAQVQYARVIHAEQGIELHRPFPAAARVNASGRITGAIDKGDKGALIFARTELTDAATNERYVTLSTVWMARGDGHFGGPTSGIAEPPPIPGRTPDLTVDYPTRPEQALLYRLLGDRNPLHIDPEAARRAGFERPILHGLCTYGITCLVVLESCAGFEPERIVSHSLRFSAPVWPGDTLSVDLWRDADVVSFEVRAKERGTVVVRNGRTVLR